LPTETLVTIESCGHRHAVVIVGEPRGRKQPTRLGADRRGFEGELEGGFHVEQ
jgi:hypothetical protein